MARILVIDDDTTIRSLLREVLVKKGYEVTEAINSEEGIEAYNADPADLVITDIFMPGRDGHGTIEKLKREHPEVKIIAMTGHGDSRDTDKNSFLRIAESLGALRTFHKPFSVFDILSAVEELVVKSD